MFFLTKTHAFRQSEERLSPVYTKKLSDHGNAWEMWKDSRLSRVNRTECIRVVLSCHLDSCNLRQQAAGARRNWSATSPKEEQRKRLPTLGRVTRRSVCRTASGCSEISPSPNRTPRTATCSTKLHKRRNYRHSRRNTRYLGKNRWQLEYRSCRSRP